MNPTLVALQKSRARFDAIAVVIALHNEGHISKLDIPGIIEVLTEGSKICNDEIKRLSRRKK